jgi:hypothetical protein
MPITVTILRMRKIQCIQITIQALQIRIILFELGMASLKADYNIGKVEAVADFGFGKRAEEFSYNDKGTLASIMQAFIAYSPSNKVKFTMGKWVYSCWL